VERIWRNRYPPDSPPPERSRPPQQLRPGLARFNVQEINGNVYVTHANHRPPRPQEREWGALAVFTESGTLKSSSFVDDQLTSLWRLWPLRDQKPIRGQPRVASPPKASPPLDAV
jgi:hypothetical protein